MGLETTDLVPMKERGGNALTVRMGGVALATLRVSTFLTLKGKTSDE